jgi:hypothetical protein
MKIVRRREKIVYKKEREREREYDREYDKSMIRVFTYYLQE